MTDANPNRRGALSFRGFICDPEHAVECAYLLNLAEAEYARDPSSNAAEARAEKAEAERDASRWQPIETAPKDRPILAWCDHEADPYSVDDKTLTTYAAHAEGLGHAPTGCHIVEWGGGWTESYEDGGGEMSDWWFVAGSEFEVAANPTHWMPLPASPANPENPAHD